MGGVFAKGKNDNKIKKDKGAKKDEGKDTEVDNTKDEGLKNEQIHKDEEELEKKSPRTDHTQSQSPKLAAQRQPDYSRHYGRYARHAGSTEDSNPQAYGSWSIRQQTFILPDTAAARYKSVVRSQKAYIALPADLLVILNHPQSLHGRSRSFLRRTNMEDLSASGCRPDTAPELAGRVPLCDGGDGHGDKIEPPEMEMQRPGTTACVETKMISLQRKYGPPLKRRKPYLPAHLFQKIKIHDVTNQNKTKSKNRPKLTST